MLSVVAWKWRGTRDYTSGHVNVLARAISANLSTPHEFVCVTDDPAGLDPGIRAVPLPAFEHLRVRRGYPSCYVRLRAFDPEFAAQLGPRFLMIDVDAVITGRLDHLVARTEDFVIWENPDRPGAIHYQGGLMLMDAGARPQVWERFEGEASRDITARRGLIGSDQAWITHCLYPGEASWTRADGLAFGRDCKRGYPPPGACMVQITGSRKPWHPAFRVKHPGVWKHWSRYADMDQLSRLARRKDNASTRAHPPVTEPPGDPGGPCARGEDRLAAGAKA